MIDGVISKKMMSRAVYVDYDPILPFTSDICAFEALFDRAIPAASCKESPCDEISVAICWICASLSEATLTDFISWACIQRGAAIINMNKTVLRFFIGWAN